MTDDLGYSDAIKKVTFYEVCSWIRFSLDDVKNETFMKSFELFYKSNPNLHDANSIEEMINLMTSGFDDESSINELELLDIEEVCAEEATPISINEAFLLLKRLEGVTSYDPSLKESFYKLKAKILESYRKKR